MYRRTGVGERESYIFVEGERSREGVCNGKKKELEEESKKEKDFLFAWRKMVLSAKERECLCREEGKASKDVLF